MHPSGFVREFPQLSQDQTFWYSDMAECVHWHGYLVQYHPVPVISSMSDGMTPSEVFRFGGCARDVLVYDGLMNSTESTTTGVMGYEVVSGSPVVGQSGSITGEYVFTGKRGATNVTYRANASVGSFQFMRLSGVFCALHGNYTLPVDYVAAGAVVFSDADRVA